MTRTIPLSTWRCDVCGEVTVTPQDGYVAWRHDGGTGPKVDIKIFHKARCDPGREYASSGALEDFLGSDGLTTALSWLSPGLVRNYDYATPPVKSLSEYVDFVRRVQTPHYEEARDALRSEELQDDLNDANEVFPYVQSSLIDYASRP